MPHRETTDGKGRPRLLLYALLTSLTAISIDAILPGLLSIEESLRAQSPLPTQHVVSLVVFGMVFGELLIGPASDAFGRKAALIAGLVVNFLGTVIAMTAGSQSRAMQKTVRQSEPTGTVLEGSVAISPSGNRATERAPLASAAG